MSLLNVVRVRNKQFLKNQLYTGKTPGIPMLIYEILMRNKLKTFCVLLEQLIAAHLVLGQWYSLEWLTQHFTQYYIPFSDKAVRYALNKGVNAGLLKVQKRLNGKRGGQQLYYYFPTLGDIGDLLKVDWSKPIVYDISTPKEKLKSTGKYKAWKNDSIVRRFNNGAFTGTRQWLAEIHCVSITQIRNYEKTNNFIKKFENIRRKRLTKAEIDALPRIQGKKGAVFLEAYQHTDKDGNPIDVTPKRLPNLYWAALPYWNAGYVIVEAVQQANSYQFDEIAWIEWQLQHGYSVTASENQRFEARQQHRRTHDSRLAVRIASFKRRKEPGYWVDNGSQNVKSKQDKWEEDKGIGYWGRMKKRNTPLRP